VAVLAGQVDEPLEPLWQRQRAHLIEDGWSSGAVSS
jgi:hypothetical protein